MFVRRIGNIFYTCEFAALVFSESILSSSSTSALAARAAWRCQQAGSVLLDLLPTREDSWLAMIEDIFFSPRINLLHERLLEECQFHSEFRSLSIDGTAKVCLKLLGQAHPLKPLVVRRGQALPESDALHKVISIRGRTGALVSLQAAYGEGSDDIAADLTRALRRR